jgi:hypothetical protein
MDEVTRERARAGAERAFCRVLKRRHPSLDFVPVRPDEGTDAASLLGAGHVVGSGSGPEQDRAIEEAA